MPQFIITNKRNGKQQTLKLNKDSIIIGRLETNDIPLAGKTVSRKHAEISRKATEYLLTDLESGNGTFLNGRKLKPHERQVLHDNDVFRIEEFEIRFFVESAGEATFPKEERTDSDIIEIKMIKKVLNAINTENLPNLEVVSPPFEGKKVVFNEGLKELVIGRDQDCQLSLDTPTVSRRHAVLHKKWGGVTLSDLGSKNGTLINGEKIKENLLKNGDVIYTGAVKIVFHNPQEINLEDLSKDYEKQPLPEPPKAGEAKVSQEAKISAEPNEAKKSTLPKLKKSFALKKIPLENFSNMEKLLLGSGIVILVGALVTLFWILGK